MGKVIVLMGISGAGKGTYIKESYSEEEIRGIFSADHFFTTSEGYMFDPSKLGEAHADCLRRYDLAVRVPGLQGTLIVDNTNTSLAEISPYCALALAYGHELQIVALVCPPEVAAKRNIHGTPATAILRQDTRFRATLADLPPWWPLEVVFTG